MVGSGGINQYLHDRVAVEELAFAGRWPSLRRADELDYRYGFLGDFLIIDANENYWYYPLIGCQVFAWATLNLHLMRLRREYRPDEPQYKIVREVQVVRWAGRAKIEFGRSIAPESVILR